MLILQKLATHLAKGSISCSRKVHTWATVQYHDFGAYVYTINLGLQSTKNTMACIPNSGSKGNSFGHFEGSLGTLKVLWALWRLRKIHIKVGLEKRVGLLVRRSSSFLGLAWFLHVDK